MVNLVVFFIKLYKTVEYNMDIMRHFACLVVDPITVHSSGFLFLLHNGRPDLRANDGSDLKLKSNSWCLMLVIGWAHSSST